MNNAPKESPRLVGFLGYDGIQSLDLVGPMEVFSSARLPGASGKDHKAYEVRLIGLTSRPFAGSSGLVFKPQATINDTPRLDTLIVPGGHGLRDERILSVALPWLRRLAGTARRVATVCTGIYGLAPTGLLDGRRVTTHWRFAEDLGRRFPALKVDADPLFIKDGKFYSSAGVTAGIDLALALIEEDFGPPMALAIARDLVVFLKRSGSQAQYSEPLKLQVQSNDRFNALTGWILAHLDGGLSIDSLAAEAGLSPRHFSRKFKTAFAQTPAAYVESIRLSEARRRLTTTTAGIDAIAASVGYGSADAFRRSFERQIGVNPSVYRNRFGSRCWQHPVGSSLNTNSKATSNS